MKVRSCPYAVMVSLALPLFISPIFAQLANSPWPMFHHDARHTGQSEYAGPSIPTKLAWSYETGSEICSLPSIGDNGKIYVGSCDNNFYSVNSIGRLEWSYVTDYSVPSSPALGINGRIFIGSWDKNVYVFNLNGILDWSYFTGDRIESSPAIGGSGRIYIGSWDHNFYAMNSNGALNWSYQTVTWVTSSPALGNDENIYIGIPATTDSAQYCIALTSMGSLLWSYNNILSPVLGNDGVLYVASDDYRLCSLSSVGNIEWSYKIGSWISPPAAGNDERIYIACGGDNSIYSFSSIGALSWSYEMSSWISSPMLGNDERIYFVSSDCMFQSLSPTGELSWGYETCSWDSSPTLGSDGKIYIGSSNKLYCIEQGPTPTPIPILEGFLNSISLKEWDYLTLDVTVQPLINAFDAYGAIITPGGRIYSFNISNPHSLRAGLSPLIQNVHGLWAPLQRRLFETYVPSGLTGEYQFIVGLVPAGVRPALQNAIPRCLWQGTVTVTANP